MSHIVLLGDSIFDNATYVPGEPAVIDQVRVRIPESDFATLLAVDGHVTSSVARQLSGLPDDATHLFVSVGGNDALGYQYILTGGGQILSEAVSAYESFRQNYQKMLDAVTAVGLPTTVCTIYDSVPRLPKEAVTLLSIFNDVILREAFSRGLPVIDLRLVCNEYDDYAESPIEPSSKGGAKIARVIASVLEEHDFGSERSRIYW